MLKSIALLVCSLLITACGGGSSSSNNTSTTETESTDSTNQASSNYPLFTVDTTPEDVNARTLGLLGGIWKGSVKTYSNDTISCEWDIVLNLSSTEILDSNPPMGATFSSNFLGDVSAELIFVSNENTDECKSDSFSFDWEGECYLATLRSNSCSLDVRRYGDFFRFSNSDTLQFLLNKSVLSMDETRIFIERNRNYDPSVSLMRME